VSQTPDASRHRTPAVAPGADDEQAALRRVAELVARGADRQAVLEAIVAEAFTLFPVGFTALLRYELDGAASIVALHHGPPGLAVGERAPHLPDGLVLRVFRSRAPSRVDAYAELPGAGVARMRELGITAGAAAPILVDGHLWGVLAAMTSTGTVALGLEQVLARFADLAATAVAGAQAKDELRALANEQSALRRVAELAARDAPADEVLHAVALEASHLVDVDFTTILRYEPDGNVEIVALSGAPAPAHLTIGGRNPNSGDGVTQRVWRTHRSARIDHFASVPSEWSEIALALGFTTSAAVPILIQGRLWGTLVVVGRGEPLTEAIEDSLTNFADLTGTAISNAQARQDLRALADEQAAFRRVAELVAHGTALDRVFQAVTREASKLLGGLATTLQRADPDGSVTTVAAHPPHDSTPEATTTEQSVPVTVEGQVWGVLSAHSTGDGLTGETGDRLRQFAELASVAIANAENKAKLTASRARVMATADETRRRLQRDVHDGAQQRLVQTIITLKLALAAAVDGRTSDDRVAEALHHAERANRELRDLVRGILPASLTQGGLGTGLESLVGDISTPVRLRMDAPRLPSEIETTAYFIVAEALTNVVKHAGATQAEVTVELDGSQLSITVSDDGVGGADPSSGGGLTGLSDRVAAADGTWAITSPVGSGTTLRVSLPT
jgi:signal transduction histidine kinase